MVVLERLSAIAAPFSLSAPVHQLAKNLESLTGISGNYLFVHYLTSVSLEG